MQSIKDKMYEYKIRSIFNLDKNNLPIIFNFENKDYELRYTHNNGLVLTKINNSKYDIKQESINVG
jgi:hypothetical protein